MGQTNNCNYCKHKFKFKFPYKRWIDVMKVISKKDRRETETITFMWEDKPWMIDDNCQLYEINDSLYIELVEPLTSTEANKKGEKWDYHYPDINIIPKNRDFKLLQTIKKEYRKLDFNIVINDRLNDENTHYCNIRKITGKKHIKIWLEEAWHCER